MKFYLTHFSNTSVKIKKILTLNQNHNLVYPALLFICLCARAFLRLVENSPWHGNFMCCGLL